ncbi:NAD(P)H-dependent oxidoreductase [Flavobacterium aquatile]|uniref:NADPH quinone reductase MdaB n=1 Tax=Flavobacterium aquatile LMG 4008 = ATCC 11947 TaxID=1453498 RepID=A0A095STB5_9FLAO|nr:NAD(P)H-dependent oxidoreductase [Flavobacterium aquatile]KGD67832.1 NADPH quinone reductase MdaB [Flavobacterium aquatile LMG 4008 = ATCC 11947]OXA67694.1 NADPH quinone reductase MdaB [Flavobacterium aquatile LMG 4008 = ATCC 11947]GEC78331.1 modulator of drug activity B [Flavobacterium aquatile]
MTKIFIINGGQKFGHSGGKFNETIAKETLEFFKNNSNFEVKTTDVNDEYNPAEEVEKYVWADVVIYHTPIWWFQLPHGFKKYIDIVFTEGHDKGIYHSDGRSSKNPAINYGTGGMLHGRKYLLTTSWNAPKEAFTLPGEFFNETSVDDGPLFGFHRMNAFTGMTSLPSMHFHDIEKNADVPRDLEQYKKHLTNLFLN